jgi:hypothetical protein
MMVPIIIFLMVLSPLFIPVAVTVVHEFANWRARRRGLPVGSLTHVRPTVRVAPVAA